MVSHLFFYQLALIGHWFRLMPSNMYCGFKQLSEYNTADSFD